MENRLVYQVDGHSINEFYCFNPFHSLGVQREVLKLLCFVDFSLTVEVLQES